MGSAICREPRNRFPVDAEVHIYLLLLANRDSMYLLMQQQQKGWRCNPALPKYKTRYNYFLVKIATRCVKYIANKVTN